ncbi:hypothetical protein ACFO4P_04375 [Epilithonimonas pallida]|nr:hypothetical protein [Epilithonimonas pallida]
MNSCLDYEGMGDDLLRDSDRVYANNMDDFLAPTPRVTFQTSW